MLCSILSMVLNRAITASSGNKSFYISKVGLNTIDLFSLYVLISGDFLPLCFYKLCVDMHWWKTKFE